jgi:hypothetical protein
MHAVNTTRGANNMLNNSIKHLISRWTVNPRSPLYHSYSYTTHGPNYTNAEIMLSNQHVLQVNEAAAGRFVYGCYWVQPYRVSRSAYRKTANSAITI